MANQSEGFGAGDERARSASAGDVEPVIDQWYIREDTQEKFVVTDYDEDAGSIEIQTVDGDVGEMDQEEWDSTRLTLTEASQDWTKSIDNEPADDDVRPGAGEGARSAEDNPSVDGEPLSR